MPTNDFLPFAVDVNAGVMSQADYAERAGLGVVPGIADPDFANKAWRQAANMAAALGEMIKAQGINALDNGDIAALASNLIAAYAAFLLPRSGGEMRGSIVAKTHPALSRQNDNSYLAICGGTTNNVANGAFLYLYGANGSQPGAFRLNTGVNSHSLFGKSDGTLTWDSLPLVCGEFYNEHCKLNNNVEMECGYVNAAVGENVITFKRAFTVGATPKVFVQPWTNNAVNNANVYALSTTGFSFNVSQATGVLYFAVNLAE